jgi:hypothetical protein
MKILMIQQKSKAISVLGRRGPYGCKTSSLLHFLDSRLTDGGEVVSLMHRTPATPPRRFLIKFSGRDLNQLQGKSGPGRIGSIKKSSDLIGNGSRGLPACNIMPRPTTLQRAPTISVLRATTLQHFHICAAYSHLSVA